MWHVVFAEPGQLPRSRAARSRDAAIHVACELLAAGCDVRRVIEPSGSFIERSELDEHYDEGHFPGLMRTAHRSSWAWPDDLNRCICRSRRRVGRCEFSARLLR
jgi:hypothetical protein